MKIILAFLILFCVFTSPTFAELTDADLNKIRLIVTEAIQKEITPIKADIATLKTDMALMKIEVANLKQNVNDRFTSVNDRFTSVNDRFDDIQKNFDRQNNIIIACIGISLAILAIGATVWAF